MQTGTVKFFNAKKAWGFITPDDGSGEIFVHAKNVMNNNELGDGDKVEFVKDKGPKGWRAINVRLAPMSQRMENYKLEDPCVGLDGEPLQPKTAWNRP